VVLIAAVAAAALAASAHLFIFVSESILFSRSSTLRMLEVQPADAGAVRLWAFHQGVYNALLAALAVAGAVALVVGGVTVGRTMLGAAFGMMAVAAAALLIADRRRARVPGFLAQAVPAVGGIVAVLLL
jgi:putative membrane protein